MATQSLSGCFEVAERLDERPETSAGAHPGRIQHVALSWLKEPGNPAHVDEWVRAARALGAIPGVESMVIGPAAPVSWSDPDQSFDFAMTIVFENRDAMEAYQPHPTHHAAIAVSNRIMKRVYAYYVELHAYAESR
ncbi:Dabb family protein [Pseudonocardia halophobica]|uniref:Dabb family protein n=1 Tax=Pseudonocardia halophobica TaxID=29401 RepID=UPI003D91DE88